MSTTDATTGIAIDNPYLGEALATLAHAGEITRRARELSRAGMREEWMALLRSQPDIYQDRSRMVAKYSWAIPDDVALDALAACAPLVEIGAGTGYWAWLLRGRGVDILAFDIEPPATSEHQNEFHRQREVVGTTWTEVLPGGPEEAAKHPDRTLFLCWPPYDEPMAADCLRAYERAGGRKLVYVGEDEGGCTGNEAFHWLLRRGWDQISVIAIPQWKGMRDYLTVWARTERKGRDARDERDS